MQLDSVLSRGEYGFMDFNGYILFTINRFFVFEGKKNRQIKAPVFFHFGGFKNGVVYVGRGNYTENMIKAVIY